MRNFSEKDWKLFRKKLPDWQEAYMERLCKEYIDLLSSDINAADRFWELEKRIEADRKKTGVVATMSRSKMIFNIADLQLEDMGVFTTHGYDPGVSEEKLEELRRFGESLK